MGSVYSNIRMVGLYFMRYGVVVDGLYVRRFLVKIAWIMGLSNAKRGTETDNPRLGIFMVCTRNNDKRFRYPSAVGGS